MPNSIRENNNDVRAFVATHPEIKIVLDVGPGEGTYHWLIQDLIDAMDGVEIWEKNVEDFSLRNRYRSIIVNDIRETIDAIHLYDYDMIIFGDVLEHLPLVDAIDVFHKALKLAPWVLVSVPMQHFEQGAIDGNEHEHHEIEDPQIDLIPKLPVPRYWWTYRVTGTFIYQGTMAVEAAEAA